MSSGWTSQHPPRSPSKSNRYVPVRSCAATAAVAAAPPRTTSPLYAASTTTRSPTATSTRSTTRRARSPNPRRLPTTRSAVADVRLAEINRVAATTGNDPELDALLPRLHTETACRRGGALALRPIDLDADQCLIRLREKGDTIRWQPVSPTLMAHLERHAAERRSPRTGQLLRYRTGKPITHRRYDHLWVRIGQHLAWVATQQISTHWLRHTTLTWVERTFGYAVARAGHNDSAGDATTTTYVRATPQEVAAALAALVGEHHPLADPHTLD